MSFVIRSRTTTENCVTCALCNVYLTIRITTSFLNLMNAFNPPTTELFRPTFTAKGVLQPPGFVTFRSNYFVKLFMGMFLGSRNPMVIVKIFYLYRVTLKLRVIICSRMGYHCA